MSTYIVLVLCHNEIHHCEPFGSIMDAESMAVSLANEWYKRDGIESFGEEKIRTVEEMKDYYGSDEYFNSSDAAHICIERVELKDSR